MDFGSNRTSLKRLVAEYKELATNPPEGIVAGPISESNIYIWEALFAGPQGTIYEGGIYLAKIFFPKDYPLNPPIVKFVCPIFHPNVFAKKAQTEEKKMLGAKPKSHDGYLIGECIGRGSFGTVYSGLNLNTGEVVAVKIAKTTNRHNNTVVALMQEIELLKELSHHNIVKYLGSSLTPDALLIYMEFCESGSLKTMVKKYGIFSEKLASVYTFQVLEGLIYLHGQGIIHNDVKAANILTNKDGQIKIADFGIAARMNESNESMIGSPYWMAPEIINLNDPVPESDVWSVGCTVIEMIQGAPPYWHLSPMSALYHIVQDETPPMPNSASPLLKSFLLECFRKDHNLRINTSKLISHRWVNLRRNDYVNDAKNKPSSSLVNNDIKSNEKNDAIVDNRATGKDTSNKLSHDLLSDAEDWNIGLELSDDNSERSNLSLVADDDTDDIGNYLELNEDEDLVLNKPGIASSQEPCLVTYRPFFSKFNRLTFKSLTGHLAIESVIEDEFWNEDEYFKKNEKSVWIGATVEKFLDCIKSDNIDNIRANLKELDALFKETPGHRKYLITHHCQLPIVEKLENSKNNYDLVSLLLKFINDVSSQNEEFQESICLLGVIPSVLHYTKSIYSYYIRTLASYFVKNLCCNSNATIVQMFMSCRGLDTLISYFNEEYPKHELARNATDCVDSLLNLQCSTPRSTICTVFVSKGIVPRMINSLNHFITSSDASIHSDMYSAKIVNIFMMFSLAGGVVSELFVKNEKSISDLIRITPGLKSDSLLKLLKCLKNISMNPDTLDVLHNAGACKFLVSILDKRYLPNYREIQNQALNIAFNLCRINRDRLYVAIDCGFLAHLLPILDLNSPIKQLALPLLCEAAHVGPYCRQIVHMQGIMDAYIRLLSDANWQVSALDSLMCWYETDQERSIIERVLVTNDTIGKIINILESRQSRDVLSVLINFKTIVTQSAHIHQNIFNHKKKIIESLCKLSHDQEAQIRLCVLRLLLPFMDAIVFDVSDLPQVELVEKTARYLCQEDVAILVREVARKLRIKIINIKSFLSVSHNISQKSV